MIRRAVLALGLAPRLRRLRDALRISVLRLCSRSPLLATHNYVVASPAFRREQRAVLYGRLRHEEDNRLASRSEYRLRRNVHRLEKGIIMRPRREVFAAEYIEDTVLSFAERVGELSASAHGNGNGNGNGTGHAPSAAVALPAGEAGELRWARDVLYAYFRVAGGHPAIERARGRFRALGVEPEAEARPVAPYLRELSRPPAVSYDALNALMNRRRSVRWFLPRPVPRELIDKAVLAAAQSPSACNRQPFHFRVFDDRELAVRVASLPAGTQGFEHNFPVVVAVVGRLRAYFDEKDRHVIYIDGGLAAMSFVLALETLGLASCCINWPDVERQERGMAKLLGLEPDERVIMLIALGWPDPDALVPASGKKSLDALRRYNATA